MRIWLVLHAFAPECVGGTERTVEALARALQARGHEPTVVAGSLELGDASRPTESAWRGLRVLRLHRNDLYFDGWLKAYAPELSQGFARLLARERPDVVHVHHWIRLTTDLVRQARALGCTTAVTLHDYFACLARPVRRIGEDQATPPEVPPYVNEAERREAFALHRRDLLAEVQAAHLRLTLSQAQAAGLAALGIGDLAIQGIVPPPVLERPRRVAPRPRRGKRLLAFATWYPDKGLHVVLEALQQAEGWSLQVFGKPHPEPYAARIADLARGLDVQLRGTFAIDDLRCSGADYAVLPTLCHESYGLTLDEALCLGLPAVLSDVPSYRERAPLGSVAFFPAGDAAALATLLRSGGLEVLTDPSEPELWSIERVAERHIELYERARRGELGPVAGALQVPAEERAAALFRRAERRLWTALQAPEPKAPPDGFLP